MSIDFAVQAGARYGTTSCAIANVLGNSGNVVSVEPDHRVWNILDENRVSHNCNFWIVRGVIGDSPMEISGKMYSSRSSVRDSQKGAKRDKCEVAGPGYEYYTFTDIQSVTKLNFTALLIDCEGCIETMFRGSKLPLCSLIENVNTIILEADMPVDAADCEYDCVDYDKWIRRFNSCGLQTIVKKKDPVFSKIYHMVFQRG